MKPGGRKKANLAIFLGRTPAGVFEAGVEGSDQPGGPYPPAAILRQMAWAISRVPTAVGSSRLAFMS